MEKETGPNPCDGCSQADGCKEAYRQLGCTDGPSVTRTVLVAFLLPLVLFIGSLGAFGWWLEGTAGGPYRTPLALLLALLVTAGAMLTIRAVSRRRSGK
jgi:hypothetical protein